MATYTCKCRKFKNTINKNWQDFCTDYYMHINKLYINFVTQTLLIFGKGLV